MKKTGTTDEDCPWSCFTTEMDTIDEVLQFLIIFLSIYTKYNIGNNDIGIDNEQVQQEEL